MRDHLKSLLIGLLVACGVVAGLEARHAGAASGQTGGVNGVQAQGYNFDAQPGAFRAGIVLADSLSFANLTSTTTGPTTPPSAGCARFTLGSAAQGCRVNITVWAHFSVASQTCQVAILYEDHDANGALTDLPGPSGTQTLTGASIGGWIDTAGKFVSGPAYFDGSGATHVRIVLVTAPASGTVDFHVGST